MDTIARTLATLLIAAEETAGAMPSPWVRLLPFALVGLIFYVIVILPGQKQRKAQETMWASLKKDDEVITSSGMWGRIVALEATVAHLEIDNKVKVRILRDRIAGPWPTTTTAITSSQTVKNN